ncbi:helix-turn-helix domain-containing protein [Steroidobacter sp.]|uniref:helix-turn-helix domain-containing protein n=1 Tax=Steroidobacter sp. TaxID=1978227 RepID=UPI001A3D3A6F|nr:AraC family transcriptional regulator [Steroidobacter sp.]MBL8269004.1 helix-turn-helix transcriptional regulator [Steroidobacter sp.]
MKPTPARMQLTISTELGVYGRESYMAPPPVTDPTAGLPFEARTSRITAMEDLLATLKAQQTPAGVRTGDGVRHPLPDGSGFRHDYDAEVARGGWDFYLVGEGLSVALVEFVACRKIARLHSLGDHLVISAVIEGNSHITAPGGGSGELSNGYCTIYGMQTGEEFETVYESGRPLKWVSIFIDRHAFFSATRLQTLDLPPALRSFIQDGMRLAHRNIPLSNAASLTVQQMLERPFKGGLQRAYLHGKALELICHVMFTMAHDSLEELSDVAFSTADYAKLEKAMAYIKRSLDEPFSIAELATAVGMTRQRLQLGFRVVYGDTVGRIRDKVRMERALNLVRSSNLSMIDIGLEAGYEHPASFTRAFKAAFGVSPARMRRLSEQSTLTTKVADHPESVSDE